MKELKSIPIINRDEWKSYIHSFSGLQIYYNKRLNIPTYEETIYFGAADTYHYFNKTMNVEIIEKEGIEIKYERITDKKH